tara:strand:- start:4400 stop:7021 length:2622 start_codon:yes stop_codon:yes gene_type:complete
MIFLLILFVVSSFAELYEGDISHKSAYSNEIKHTAHILQREIANVIRRDFNFLRQSVTVFADEDKFVREGIVFCNPKKLVPKDSTLPTGVKTCGDITGSGGGHYDCSGVDNDLHLLPASIECGTNCVSSKCCTILPGSLDLSNTAVANYHEDTGLLRPNDGFGQYLSSEEESKICGSNRCEEGSFVSLLTSRIRSLGYHTTHSDICVAHVAKALSEDIVPHARTCNMTRNVEPRKVRACTRNAYVSNNDYFHFNRKCYIATDVFSCHDIKDGEKQMCIFDTQESLCYASYDYLKELQECPKDKTSEDIEADEAGVMNGIRRVISYSIKNNGPVDTTDKVYVTGVTDGQGCRTLRQYIAAINGIAQINAFRDTGIIEAQNYWEDLIKEARSFIQRFSEIANDFYELSTEIFPLIEFEDVQECPVGFVEKNFDNLGTESTPLCDNKDYASKAVMNKMSFQAQSLARSECFCRMGSLYKGNGRDTGQDDKITDIYELDELYLGIDASKITSKCSSLVELESVYHFCVSGMLESNRWRTVLEDLEPDIHSIKHYRSTSSRQDLTDKLLESLPLVSSNYEPNCGRLLTAGETPLYSNKGANCVPFAKMNEILYRLEFETSEINSGRVRGFHINNGVKHVDKLNTFQDTFCRMSDKLANTYFTFRQLTYKWDEPIYMSNAATLTPKISDNILGKFPNFEQQKNYNSSKLQDKVFWFHDITSDEGLTKVPMCNVDWTSEIVGRSQVQDAAGTLYDDPYALLRRQIDEAIFNVNIAFQSKEKTQMENEILWDAIESELTSLDPERMNWKISMEVAEHFMRVTTTDSDDNAVDSNDPGADGDDNPSPISSSCSTPQLQSGSVNDICGICDGDGSTCSTGTPT